MNAMTDDERRLAELAVRKRDLNEELRDANKEMRKLVKVVDLPLIIALNGNAVSISVPQYNGLPICTVARCAR